MRKIIVVAKSDNNAIGKGNDLLWHLPADLAHFESTIQGEWLITGRKSFESAQGTDIFSNPEKVIIVTRRKDFQHPIAKVAHSVEESFQIAETGGAEKVMILGGGEIYKQTIDLADEIILTEVHHHFEAETFFPEIKRAEWEETKRIDHKKDGDNAYDYSFVFLKRKQ